MRFAAVDGDEQDNEETEHDLLDAVAETEPDQKGRELRDEEDACESARVAADPPSRAVPPTMTARSSERDRVGRRSRPRRR